MAYRQEAYRSPVTRVRYGTSPLSIRPWAFETGWGFRVCGQWPIHHVRVWRGLPRCGDSLFVMLGLIQGRLPNVGVREVGTGNVGAVEMCAVKGGAAKVGIPKVGVPQVRAHERGSAQIRTAQV